MTVRNTEDLLHALRHSSEHLSPFNTIAKALTSTLNPHEVLGVIIGQVSLLLRPSHWSLVLYDGEGETLQVELAIGEGCSRLKGRSLNDVHGPVIEAITTGEIQIASQIEDGTHVTSLLDRPKDARGRSVLALPLKARGRVLGAIELVDALDDQVEKGDLQALKAIADYAAIAIENARAFETVQKLTIIDEHTRLFNARHLRNVLEHEIARAERYHHPLSLLFIDLDRFKEINDQHGHLAGSALLRAVGDILRNSIRKVDSAFRYGGDEFAILLVETPQNSAMVVAKRIRQVFLRTSFLEEKGLSIKMSASIGISTFPEDAKTVEDLLSSADKTMYRAKSIGQGEVAATGDIQVAGELETT